MNYTKQDGFWKEYRGYWIKQGSDWKKISRQFNKVSGNWKENWYSVSSPEDSLVALWDMNTTSGSTLLDQSGNNNNGTIVGAKKSTTFHFGSMYFDGVDDYINFGTNSALKLTSNSTWSMWIKHLNTGRRENPWASAYGGEGTWTLEGSNSISGYIGTAGGNTTPYTNFSTNNTAGAPIYVGRAYLDKGEWHLCTQVRDFDAGVVRWYIDGIQQTEQTISYSSLTASSNNMYIARGYVNYFTGWIGETRIYSKALSDDEVYNLYRYGQFLQHPSGVADYDFESLPLQDNSGNNNNQVSSSNVRLVSGRRGSALDVYYNSSDSYIEVGNSTTLNIEKEISMSAWIYPRSYRDRGCICTKNGSYYFQLHIDGSLQVYTYAGDGGGSTYDGSNSTIPLNTWTHVGWSESFTGLRTIYVNGEVDKISQREEGIRSRTDNLRIGKEFSGRQFDGLIEDLHVYDQCLKSDQFRLLYHQKKYIDGMFGDGAGISINQPVSGSTDLVNKNINCWVKTGQIYTDAGTEFFWDHDNYPSTEGKRGGWQLLYNFGNNNRFKNNTIGINSTGDLSAAGIDYYLTSINSSSYTPSDNYLQWFYSGGPNGTLEFSFPSWATKYYIKYGTTSATSYIEEYNGSSWSVVDSIAHSQGGGSNQPEENKRFISDIPSSRRVRERETSVSTIWWIFIK